MKKTYLIIILVIIVVILFFVFKKKKTAKQIAQKRITKTSTKQTKEVVQPKEVVHLQNLENYIVVKGDTLSKIAQRTNISMSRILKVNPQIKNPNLIRIGQIIKIPK